MLGLLLNLYLLINRVSRLCSKVLRRERCFLHCHCKKRWKEREDEKEGKRGQEHRRIFYLHFKWTNKQCRFLSDRQHGEKVQTPVFHGFFVSRVGFWSCCYCVALFRKCMDHFFIIDIFVYHSYMIHQFATSRSVVVRKVSSVFAAPGR